MQGVRFWLKRIFGRRRMEREMAEEMEFHRAERVAELERGGLSAEEARRRANIEFGGIEQYKELSREARRLNWLHGAGQDAHYALRGLRRSPGFALTAILTLALGIGATTAIFSAVYALLIRPLPYRDPGRLLWITEQRPEMGDAPLQSDAVAWNERAHLLEAVATYTDQQYTLTGVGEAERIAGAQVSSSFLRTLGAGVQRGRDFAPDEGQAKEVMITDAMWRKRFHSDPRVLGAVINLDDKPFVVVGIVPRNFRFPDMALVPELLVVMSNGPDIANPRKGVSFVQTIGRARAERADLSAVRAELQSVQAAQARTYDPWVAEFSKGAIVGVTPLQNHLVGDSRAPVLILFGAVALVLLIACANIANLQLVRAAARRHEVAVRGALGASRTRLVRQFLTESLVLAGLAVGAGLLLGYFGIEAIRSLRLREVPWLETVTLDPYVFLFTIAVAIAAALMFGVAPAVSGSRARAMEALKAVSTRIAGGREHGWLRHAFVVAELALALVLLVGAGLLLRSFAALMRTDPGFDPKNVLSARVRLPLERYKDKGTAAGYGSDLLARTRALPGVRYAALSTSIPLQSYSMLVMIAFHPVQMGEGKPFYRGPSTPVISITPDFFRAMGTPLLEGRAFTDQDNSQSMAVGIVNRTFARKLLNGEALGKTVYSSAVGDCANCLHNGTFMPVQIVGVIPDMRHDGLEQPVGPELYLPFAQMSHFSIHLVLKSSSDSSALAAPLRAAVLGIDSTIPAYEISTLEHRLAESLAQRRLTMFLLSSFAALALLLASIGVYGVISYTVLRRTQEIGVRMALGATRGGILRLVLGQQSRVILLGSLLGLVLALATSGLLSSLLYGVKPRDGFTLGASWLVLTAVALLASAVPALRATRCDPTVALRYE